MAFSLLNKSKKDKKSKRKKNSESSIPKSALSSGEVGGKQASGYRAKFVQTICRNKPAQYAIIALSTVAILLYLFLVWLH